MRRLLIRSTMITVVVTTTVLAVPTILLLLYLQSLPPRDRVARAQDLVAPGVLYQQLAIVVAVFAVALVVSALVARAHAKALTEPLADLAVLAERMGMGELRVHPLTSGIKEVDGISEVLARSAAELTRNLASERQFAADASHQLRTPLTALLMRLEEIEGTADLEVVHEEAAIAIDQVERLSGVVDDLMGHGRHGNGERPSVSLDSVLASMQREWQPAFAAARRSMHVQGERGLQIRATRGDLAQILTTLVENSLVHGTGTVEVVARTTGPSVVIEMSDLGDGIPAELAPHVFERSVSSKGSGLGLALARDLAESNGGRLELVSAQPAVFALFLSQG